MKVNKKAVFDGAKRYARVIWAVPAVKSLALTWLIRVGVPSGIAGVAILIGDALNGGV
ncbi:hypothetical protein [Sphingobium limneticum]|uniref:hypothetical protein n=1 Tax=Sphingobium limneticum TaxID=1007511 RepID=UPI00137580BD|nr:hypothetical protein [Sphingobium limneticum]